MESRLKRIGKMLLVGFFIAIILLSLKTSYSEYSESDLQRKIKHSVEKIERFSESKMVNPDLMVDLDKDERFRLYELEEKSVQKEKFGSEKKGKQRDKMHDFVLFVPGHKGSYTQIIQMQGYLYQKINEYPIENFHFKFYSADFLSAPSAFSSSILTSQANFLQAALRFLANKCNLKTQKITVVSHSMGGIALLLALRTLSLNPNHRYVLNYIEKAIFLNSPLSKHPINIDFCLQESYSLIYGFLRQKNELKNIIFLSFTGGKGDYEVQSEISKLRVGSEFENVYWFESSQIRGVYQPLRHVETLTQPFFLNKISDFLIDFAFNKLKKLNFNVYWYFQHLSRQVHSIKTERTDKYPGFFEFLGNFTNSNVSRESCIEKNGIIPGFFYESCRIFNFNMTNLKNLMIRTQENQDKTRVYLYYRIGKEEKMHKLIYLSPEYKFDFVPGLNYRYFYVIPDNFLAGQTFFFKLIVLKQGEKEQNYQVLCEGSPQGIHYSLGFWDVLFGKEIKIELKSNFSKNLEFESVIFDPLFLEFTVFFNTSKYKQTDLILLAWHWKNQENDTNLNEIQILGTENRSTVTQEIAYPNHKILQILFPYQKSAMATIRISLSFHQIFHYLGRKMKEDTISLVPIITLVFLALQIFRINSENADFGRLILKEGWLAFVFSNINLCYWRNLSHKFLEYFGFEEGDDGTQNYKIWTMVFLVPGAGFIVTLAFYYVFSIFMAFIEILAKLVAKFFGFLSQKRGILMILAVESLVGGLSVIYQGKWLLFLMFLLLTSTGVEIMCKNDGNFPKKLSRTFFFIAFLHFLMNCNKILLLFEHMERDDDFLSSFLRDDQDLIKFSSLFVWCFQAQFLGKIKGSFLRRSVFLGLLCGVVGVLVCLGIGRVYFINYIFTMIPFVFMLVKQILMNKNDENIREFSFLSANFSFIQKSSLGLGGCIWDGALVLTKYFAKNFDALLPVFREKNILELGSGTGICGICFSRFSPKTVFLTDLKELSALMLENIELNKEFIAKDSRIIVEELIWGLEGVSQIDSIWQKASQNVDFIIASDLIDSSGKFLNDLLDTLLFCFERNKNLVIYNCYTMHKKATVQNFLDLLIEKGLIYEEIADKDMDEEYSSEDIRIIVIKKLG